MSNDGAVAIFRKLAKLPVTEQVVSRQSVCSRQIALRLAKPSSWTVGVNSLPGAGHRLFALGGWEIERLLALVEFRESNKGFFAPKCEALRMTFKRVSMLSNVYSATVH
jgi:hypothetical protein